MKFLSSFLFCIVWFSSSGNGFEFSEDLENALLSDDHIQTKPYTNDEIKVVYKKLNLKQPIDPDEYLSVTEIIARHGYPVEEHFVTTSDGYILKMHRILPTKKNSSTPRGVVFMMHGIIMSSADWIILGPEKGFPYSLADLGYDVWMGNARGNSESKNHTKLKPSHRKFWKFSWHEIGTKDVPAMIDHVLKQTKQKELHYIGHSQGTTAFLVMCSELPKYNKKIISSHLLAPIAYMKHTFSPLLRLGSKFVRMAETMTTIFGINEFLPHNSLITWLGNEFCAGDEVTHILCKNAIFMVTGFDRAEFNDTLLPLIMSKTPAGCSARQVYHYAQLIKSGGFRKYDHFPFNSLHYGPTHILLPPKYKLKNVKAPVYLYYSRNDWLSNEQDVTKLCNNLGKTCKTQTVVADNLFNHMDFMLGIDAKELIYSVVTDDLINHNK